MHLPLYNARVYWYSYVALFSHKMLKTAITVPILLLVRLPFAANRSLILEPSFLMASLTSGIVIDYSRTSQTLLRAPSPCLACINSKPPKKVINKYLTQSEKKLQHHKRLISYPPKIKHRLS